MTNAQNSPTESNAAVLLSIDAEHAHSILRGEKNFEYRRVIPTQEIPYTVYLYATQPKGVVLGKVEVVDVWTGDPEQIANATGSGTPQSKEQILEYFEGRGTAHALELGDRERFSTAPTLKWLREHDMEPSQNFRYVQEVSEA